MKIDLSASDLTTLLHPPAEWGGWKKQAACRGADPEIFFRDDSTAAYRFCEGCPVRLPCLYIGLNEEFGVWGGFSPSDRTRVRTMLQRRVRHERLMHNRPLRLPRKVPVR